MKIKVRITPEQYKCIGHVLINKPETDITVMAFLKEAFDIASKKAVRLLQEGCELTEIQETLGNMEETHERKQAS